MFQALQKIITDMNLLKENWFKIGVLLLLFLLTGILYQVLILVPEQSQIKLEQCSNTAKGKSEQLKTEVLVARIQGKVSKSYQDENYDEIDALYRQEISECERLYKK